MRRILWFRRDLRCDDNPLLSFDGEVLPIFIFDTNILKNFNPDDKRVSFLFEAVCDLKQKLKGYGLDLRVFYGDPIEVFKHLNPNLFDEVVASGDYDRYAKERDIKISQILHFRYLDDTYFFAPKEILKKDKTPYLVFTPFYNQALKLLEKKQMKPYNLGALRLYKSDFDGISHLHNQTIKKSPLTLESMGFKPQSLVILAPRDKLESLKSKLKDYKIQRDYLNEDASSSLSVDLRFGTISVRKVYRSIQGLEGASEFIRQLIFRDFYAYLLFHFPHLENENYRYRFYGTPDKERFERFCEGKTGVPLVDAGVSELLQTGFMHNRVRMVAASFFTKDLLLPWQWGEAFFAKHLLDFDAATNILSWQWSAGTGIDPQPYFRIFNPYLQAKKFDKNTHYIKRWLPELTSLEAKNIHDEVFLSSRQINNYPSPILDHRSASKIALDYFKSHR